MVHIPRYIPFLSIAAALLGRSPSRSDPIGVYGIIDRVRIAPDSTNPRTIQIWGVFSVTEGKPGDHYKPPTRGYLYYSMDSANERVVRAEWSDLRDMVGKGVIGFGSHWATSQPRVRCMTEPPARPDPYVTSIGLHRLTDPPNTIAASLNADLTSGHAPAAPCTPGGM